MKQQYLFALSIENPNWNKLTEELAIELSLLAYVDISCGLFQSQIQIDAPVNSDIAQMQTVIDGHNPNLLTSVQQDNVDKKMTKSEIKDYLWSQLINPTPDMATIRTTLEAAIGSNVNISQAIQNIAALRDYDTATNKGYINAAFDVVVLAL